MEGSAVPHFFHFRGERRLFEPTRHFNFFLVGDQEMNHKLRYQSKIYDKKIEMLFCSE